MQRRTFRRRVFGRDGYRGGQAGLATGYFLRRTGLRFRLFDRARRIGDSWRRRYDSLVLFNRDDSSWLHIPEAVDDAGNYVEDQGVSPVRGLFHVGRSWQTSRASALLCGVGDDTAQAVNRVVTSLQNPVALPQSRTLDVRLPERNQDRRETAPRLLRCSVVRKRLDVGFAW